MFVCLCVCVFFKWLKRFSIKNLKLDLHKLISGPECCHHNKLVPSVQKRVSAKYCDIFPSVQVNVSTMLCKTSDTENIYFPCLVYGMS